MPTTPTPPWFSILFGLALIVLAIGLLLRNAKAWRVAQAAESDQDELAFLQRQHRRRRQATSMIGILGLAVVVGVGVTDTVVSAFYWSSVFCGVCWMGILAITDLVATRRHYGRLLHEQMQQRASLEAELNRLKRHGGNGKP